MQNTDLSIKQKESVDFLQNNSTTIKTTTTAEETAIKTTAEQRPLNFSFSSNYTASRFSTIPQLQQHLQRQQNSKHHQSLSFEQYSSAYKSIPAFSILRREDHSLDFAGKPNAIVRPIQRTEQPPAIAKPFNVNNINRNYEGLQATGVSISQPANTNNPNHVHNFAEELNRKLHFLSNDDDHSSLSSTQWTGYRNYSQYGSQGDSTLNNRPLFITTVPTGIFLPPASELSLPTYITRRVYAYATEPFVFSAYNKLNNNNNSNNNNSKQSTHTANPNNNNANINNKTSYNASSNKTTNKNNSNNIGQSIKDKKSYNTTVPIVKSDKQLTKNTTSITTTAIGTRLPATQSLLGGVHITKQQFQQQLQQQRQQQQPQHQQHQRAKRETPTNVTYKNVMHDKRVYRGSNFGNQQYLSDTDPLDKAAYNRRRQALRNKTLNNRNQRNTLGTPPPVAGRRHEVIQTENYLEELVQRPTEQTVDTQTDLPYERLPTPILDSPLKTATKIVQHNDVATEVNEQELFDFDGEAKPIIDMFVDACIEECLLEMRHEDELEELRRKKEEFLKAHQATVAELQQLEQQQQQQQQLHQQQHQTLVQQEQQGITAAKLLQGHIATILPEVLDNLELTTDVVKKDQLMKSICPWLSAEVAAEVGNIVDSREILTIIIQEIIKQRAELYVNYKEGIETQQKNDAVDNSEGATNPETSIMPNDESNESNENNENKEVSIENVKRSKRSISNQFEGEDASSFQTEEDKLASDINNKDDETKNEESGVDKENETNLHANKNITDIKESIREIDANEEVDEIKEVDREFSKEKSNTLNQGQSKGTESQNDNNSNNDQDEEFNSEEDEISKDNYVEKDEKLESNEQSEQTDQEAHVNADNQNEKIVCDEKIETKHDDINEQEPQDEKIEEDKKEDKGIKQHEQIENDEQDEIVEQVEHNEENDKIEKEEQDDNFVQVENEDEEEHNKKVVEEKVEEVQQDEIVEKENQDENLEDEKLEQRLPDEQEKKDGRNEVFIAEESMEQLNLDNHDEKFDKGEQDGKAAQVEKLPQIPEDEQEEQIQQAEHSEEDENDKHEDKAEQIEQDNQDEKVEQEDQIRQVENIEEIRQEQDKHIEKEDHVKGEDEIEKTKLCEEEEKYELDEKNKHVEKAEQHEQDEKNKSYEQDTISNNGNSKQESEQNMNDIRTTTSSNDITDSQSNKETDKNTKDKSEMDKNDTEISQKVFEASSEENKDEAENNTKDNFNETSVDSNKEETSRESSSDNNDSEDRENSRNSATTIRKDNIQSTEEDENSIKETTTLH